MPSCFLFFLLSLAAKEKHLNNDENSDNKEEEEFEYLSSLVASGQSRLASEFELLKVLGKGGFGDVLKVISLFCYEYKSCVVIVCSCSTLAYVFSMISCQLV